MDARSSSAGRFGTQTSPNIVVVIREVHRSNVGAPEACTQKNEQRRESKLTRGVGFSGFPLLRGFRGQIELARFRNATCG